MIEVGTPEVKTVYWIRREGSFPHDEGAKADSGWKLTLNCESIGSKRD